MMKSQGLAGALGAQPQMASSQQAPQALQQLTQMLHMVSGIHNEKSYQQVRQQFAQMNGGADSRISKNYSKHEVDNFKKLLIKGINHLVGMAPQPQAPQAPQAPQPAGGAPPVVSAASSAPAPQED